jgi:hypothetical protein
MAPQPTAPPPTVQPCGIGVVQRLRWIGAARRLGHGIEARDKEI